MQNTAYANISYSADSKLGSKHGAPPVSADILSAWWFVSADNGLLLLYAARISGGTTSHDNLQRDTAAITAGRGDHLYSAICNN